MLPCYVSTVAQNRQRGSTLHVGSLNPDFFMLTCSIVHPPSSAVVSNHEPITTALYHYTTLSHLWVTRGPFNSENKLSAQHSNPVALIWRGNDQSRGVQWHTMSSLVCFCFFWLLGFLCVFVKHIQHQSDKIAFIIGTTTKSGERGGGRVERRTRLTPWH